MMNGVNGMAFDRSARGVYERFRADAARWVVPEGFADVSEIDPATILSLLRRHRQLRVMFWFRLGQWGDGARLVRGLVWFCDQRLQSGYAVDMAPNLKIDGGFYLAHPAGTAINAAHIGSGVTVVGAVTIGVRGTGQGPTIGNRAFIGAGARVIGPIHVGTRARIGANAVVVHEVPEDATVVGVPARQVR